MVGRAQHSLWPSTKLSLTPRYSAHFSFLVLKQVLNPDDYPSNYLHAVLRRDDAIPGRLDQTRLSLEVAQIGADNGRLEDCFHGELCQIPYT